MNKTVQNLKTFKTSQTEIKQIWSLEKKIYTNENKWNRLEKNKFNRFSNILFHFERFQNPLKTSYVIQITSIKSLCPHKTTKMSKTYKNKKTHTNNFSFDSLSLPLKYNNSLFSSFLHYYQSLRIFIYFSLTRIFWWYLSQQD